MDRVQIDINSLPPELRPVVAGAAVYDRTFSPRADTYYIGRDGGYYLKIAPKGALQHEARMMEFFHARGFTSRLCAYISADRDYSLMEPVRGESGIEEKHLAEPERLAEVTGGSLRRLHDAGPAGCPYTGVTSALIPQARARYESGGCDPWMLFLIDTPTPEEAYDFLTQNEDILVEDAPLHGDACLPNIILEEDFKFSGFIDFENGGLGDRHFDLLWAVWSLQHNLKTMRYTDRFLDAYGRDRFDMERYRMCAVLQAFTWEE